MDVPKEDIEDIVELEKHGHPPDYLYEEHAK